MKVHFSLSKTFRSSQTNNSMQHKLYHFILEQEETLEIITIQPPLHPYETNVILTQRRKSE